MTLQVPDRICELDDVRRHDLGEEESVNLLDQPALVDYGVSERRDDCDDDGRVDPVRNKSVFGSAKKNVETKRLSCLR